MNDDASALRNGNPYGGVPSGGITLPPYYRPTPDLVSNNLYYPGQEELRRMPRCSSPSSRRARPG